MKIVLTRGSNWGYRHFDSLPSAYSPLVDKYAVFGYCGGCFASTGLLRGECEGLAVEVYLSSLHGSVSSICMLSGSSKYIARTTSIRHSCLDYCFVSTPCKYHQKHSNKNSINHTVSNDFAAFLVPMATQPLLAILRTTCIAAVRGKAWRSSLTTSRTWVLRL